MKKSLLSLLAICGLWFFNGCGAGNTITTPPPLPATQFSVAPATATPTAGTAFMITVTALTAAGQTAASYSGTLHFTSSDALAVLPADTPMNSVSGTFSVTLNTAGSQTVSVTDSSALKGTSNAVSVVGPPNHFAVVAATYQQTIGTPLKFTVTVVDSNGTTVTTYTGTVHFTSSDPKAALPADSPLTNGVGSFSATLNTSGNETITATDTKNAAINGNTFPLPVSGPATHFSVGAGNGISAVTRSFILAAVAPLDASNNYASSYNGTVHITSSDGKAILPADATLQASAGTFQLTFETVGSQTITATDTATSSIKGTSNPITVAASSTPTITSGAPPNGVTGSTYGPTNKNYELCKKDPQTQRFTCAPCVPNTFACGGSGYPGCPRFGAWPSPCVETITTVGFQLTATGGLKPLKWSGSSLPTGLTVVAGFAGAGLIRGAPAAGSAATYNAMITITDSGNPPAPMTMTYPIIISNPPPPVVNAGAIPGGTVNQPYTFAFTASSGLAPYSNWKESGTLPTGIAPLTTAGVLAGTPTMTGPFPISITVQDADGQVSAAQDFTLQVFTHGFKTTGSMVNARTQHTATLLNDGTVLIAGGYQGTTAEIYNPATGTFALTKGSLSVERFGHTATLLANGKVLIAGGTDFTTNQPVPTAELYNPATGLFTVTAHNMNAARSNHTATLIAGGTILLAGGFNGSADVASAETYNPATDTFTSTTGPMSEGRAFHTATLLTNGKVLIAGTDNPIGLTVASAEIFDPGTGSFSSTGSMAAPRGNHTATLLTTGPNSGKVLVAGGINTAILSAAELYDSGTGTFAATGSMALQRFEYTATLLSDGTVLMAGGVGSNAAVELYDPVGGTFSATGGLQTARFNHTATLLKDGTVLVTGGNANAGGTVLATSEIYQ